MSIEIVIEKDRLYRGSIYRNRRQRQKKQADERRENLKERMASFDRRTTIRSKNLKKEDKEPYF